MKKINFKKPYAFLLGVVLALGVGAGLMTADIDVCSVKAASVSDTIVASELKATSNSYTAFSGLSKSSGAIYAGKTANNNGSIQLRSSGSDCGIVATSSGGTIKSVTVAWNSGTNSSRELGIYASNEPFTSATQLYDTGNSVGEKVYEMPTNETTYVFGSTYTYVGIRSVSSALYLDSVTFEWEADDGTPAVNITGTNSGLKGTSLELTANAINFESETLTYNWTVADDDTQLVSITDSSSQTSTIELLSAGVATINVSVSDGVNEVEESIDVTIQDVLTVSEAKLVNEDETVYVNGVVYAEYGTSLFIADEDGTGMQVFSNSNLGVAIGEEVTLKGTIDIYNDGKQISNPVVLSHEVTDRVVTPKQLTFSELTNDLLNDYVSVDNLVYLSGSLSTTSNSTIYLAENAESGKNVNIYSSRSYSAPYIEDLTTMMTDWQANVTTLTIAGPLNAYRGTFQFALASDMTFEINKVATFARSFIENLTCDSSGKTAPSIDEWNDLKNEFDTLSAEEKALFIGGSSDSLINLATEKYDYILGKYGTETYSNFMNREVVSATNNIINPTLDTTNNIIIIVAVSVLALTAIGVFVVMYRKRRLSK